MYWSDTALFDAIYIYIYIERERETERENLLHKDQLHVSAFYNGHLQVEIKKPSKRLYSTCVGYIQLYSNYVGCIQLYSACVGYIQLYSNYVGCIQLYSACVGCIQLYSNYVFCIYLITNSDLCHLLHELIAFYN